MKISPELVAKWNNVTTSKPRSLLVVQSYIDGKKARILVGCGVTDSFINEVFAKEEAGPTGQKYPRNQQVCMGDGLTCSINLFADDVSANIKITIHGITA
jgi:hypothetical protein